MANWEWPLVFFTILAQMGVGYLVIVVPGAAGKANPGWIYLLPAGLLATAMLISLVHLGHPENAYRALLHLTSSWLSREVLLFSICFLLLLVAFLAAKGGKQSQAQLAAVLALASGILGVLASALIYVLPARPAWYNFHTVLTFFLTALLLGPALGMCLEQLLPGVTPWLEGRVASRILALLLFLSIIASLSYLTFLAAAGPEAQLTLATLVASPWWWLRVLTGWLAPLALSYQLHRQERGSLSLSLALLLLLLAGELIGRALFYGTAFPLAIG